MSPFNSLCHQLIDLWVKADALEAPEDLYGPIVGQISIKMALSVLETSANDPYDWYFRRIQGFGYRSRVLDAILTKFPDGVLRDLDRAFVDQSLVPALRGVIETRRPAIDLVKTSLVGIRVGYERLMIPQKTDGTPQWCVSLAEGRFAIPFHQEAKTDLTDDGIVQLLIEGHTAKEIADMLHLSPRTIEHRIDRMKGRYEARNLVHLVAKLVGAQLDRRDVG